MKNTLSDRLQTIKIGVSQRKFAEKCGVLESTMRGYLSGKYSPSAENLLKIAQACNVTVGWLAAGG